jgi:NodT family efflux transporter outer membrane factor (OMF) lipoprotein
MAAISIRRAKAWPALTIDKPHGRAESGNGKMMGMATIFARCRAVALFSVAASALGGCASVPDSAAALRERAVPEAEVTLAGDAQGAWPDARWWDGLGDAQLSALVEEGLAGSPDMAVAAARVRRAAALARQAGAATLPVIEASGSATLEKRSYNNGFPKEFLPQGWLDNGQVAISGGFDPDLWGRNRATLAAATSEAQAAAIEARQAQLMLSTGIAAAYSDLVRLFAERDIRADALGVRTATQELVAAKLDAELETRGSLRQADAALATARANLAVTDQEIAARRHQIAALLGAGPDRGLAIARPEGGALAVAALPADATTQLLGRRADIAAARARVEAAAARIRAARADFFPAIRIEALLGLQALGIEQLLESDSTFGNVGPAISLPLFDGGARKGRYRQSQAEFDEALATYDATVVDAYREVADAVSARASLQRRVGDVSAALAASEEAYRIARLRYEGGLSTYLDVLAVEDRLLEARLASAGTDAALRANAIALVRALGGGYETGDVGDGAARAAAIAAEGNGTGG